MTLRHVHLNVRGALENFSDLELSCLFGNGAGGYQSAAEARKTLLDALEQGHRALPFGEPCEGFDYSGGGCPGHQNNKSGA